MASLIFGVSQFYSEGVEAGLTSASEAASSIPDFYLLESRSTTLLHPSYDNQNVSDQTSLQGQSCL